MTMTVAFRQLNYLLIMVWREYYDPALGVTSTGTVKLWVQVISCWMPLQSPKTKVKMLKETNSYSHHHHYQVIYIVLPGDAFRFHE